MQTAKKILPRVLRSVPGSVKAEAFFHLTANISYPLMVFMSIVLPGDDVRFHQGWFQVLVIDLPLFLASTCSISSFYLAAERAYLSENVEADFLVFAVRDGGGHAGFRYATRSAGPRSDFRSEVGVCADAEVPCGSRAPQRRRMGDSGLDAVQEVGLGLYFAAAVGYALQNENYATVPFCF